MRFCVLNVLEHFSEVSVQLLVIHEASVPNLLCMFASTLLLMNSGASTLYVSFS